MICIEDNVKLLDFVTKRIIFLVDNLTRRLGKPTFVQIAHFDTVDRKRDHQFLKLYFIQLKETLESNLV